MGACARTSGANSTHRSALTPSAIKLRRAAREMPSMSAPLLRRRRLVRELVGELGPDDDAACGFLDDIASTQGRIVQAAPDRHRTAAGDALKTLGAASELEI